MFSQLQAAPEVKASDVLQVRKTNVLKAFCQTHGWALSQPRTIQNGLLFHITPPLFSPFSLTIYNSGMHTPKQHNHNAYQHLLNALRAQEEASVPTRKIEQRFNLQDPSLRAEICKALHLLRPAEQRQEPHCEYSFRFTQGQEHLVVKQYQKGTLQIQGAAGKLYQSVLECIIPHYNLYHPNARLVVGTLLQNSGSVETDSVPPPSPSQNIHEIPLPHIGTDESGKGDYFGPMVVAAVLINAQTKPKLEALGVRDSKQLSDKRCRELAVQIREICHGEFHEVELLPERYNDLYEKFRKENKNLNHLLAWGHARAIESLLLRFSCAHAVADQFGDEHYLRSRLMEKGRQLYLTQVPKGERYLAVAAASILTRDRFLARLEKLSQEYGVSLPKGASESVIKTAKQVVEIKGREELRKLAKLHHQTTEKIIGSR